ncbi:MAG: hypothetical protein AVDCRST_MAG64-1695 [uncultured Phycisphaerae bacterium]|uniref:Uncharacterized protein n=1 Tax=uncultured Phycisphaerae bacterium TaxID=904963 RepID=A0A6J4P5X0_9BACT|nr:MAG: hypothetical protein AVDCRST_MAG64-1695 [uncultured Phycisphaerae bacterium]
MGDAHDVEREHRLGVERRRLERHLGQPAARPRPEPDLVGGPVDRVLDHPRRQPLVEHLVPLQQRVELDVVDPLLGDGPVLHVQQVGHHHPGRGCRPLVVPGRDLRDHDRADDPEDHHHAEDLDEREPGPPAAAGAAAGDDRSDWVGVAHGLPGEGRGRGAR